jgi:threonine/homoserine/homoserine lactone efflux protein
MSAEELAALLTLVTAMSFTPGPNTALSTALAVNFGLRRAMVFVAAVPVGWTLLMLGCGLGVGALLVAVPAARVAIKVGGMAYLLWLAWKLSRSAKLGQADERRLEVSFWQGVGLQFLNIKAWMLALALAGGWVSSAGGQPADNPGQRLLIVCAVMVVFAWSSNFSYALVGSVLRRWLSQGRRLLWFNRAMALLLVLTASWMVNA